MYFRFKMRLLFHLKMLFINKGDPAEEVYIIYSGWVKLVSEDYIPFVKYTEGSYFGEIEVVFKEGRTSTAYTDKETVLGIIKREQLDKIFKDFKSEEDEFKQIAIKRRTTNQIALDKAIIREKDTHPNKSTRIKIMEKFSKFINYQMLVDEKKAKSKEKDQSKGKSPTTKKWKDRNEFNKSPIEDKLSGEEPQINNEIEQDTMLNLINGDNVIDNIDNDENDSISTAKSNSGIIHDVLEVRKQVEKFRDLLENSKQSIIQFEI